MTYWTREHDAMLTELHGERGEPSYAVIADAINRQFGTSFTRNAAIGRAMRLGLAGRINVKTGKPKPPPKPRHRPGRYKPVADQDLRKARPRFNPSVPTVAEPCVPHCDEIGVLTLLEVVDRDGCRWPTGDGPIFHFCGATKFEGTSYCPWHAGAAVRHDVYVRRVA